MNSLRQKSTVRTLLVIVRVRGYHVLCRREPGVYRCVECQRYRRQEGPPISEFVKVEFCYGCTLLRLAKWRLK